MVTHALVFNPPTGLEAAVEDLEALFESPSLVLLGEGPPHARAMAGAIQAGRATGNLVHDAHIAALLVRERVLDQ